MRATKPFLVETSKLKRSESFEELTKGLDTIAEDENIEMHYLLSTTAVVKRC